MALWRVQPSDWSTHNGTASNANYGGSYKDTTFFDAYNGKVAQLRVEKTKATAGENYSITYGGSSVSVGGNKPFTNAKFDLLSNTCGAAYAVRVYNRTLTAQEKSFNTFADKMIYNGVDFDAFNALSDSLKEMYIKSTEALDLTAGVEAYTEALSSVIDFAEKEAAMREKTDYDKLYVGADGSTTAAGGKLVSLFSAYGDNTVSVDFANNAWRDKVGKYDITLSGGAYDATANKGYWKLREDGGFGYDLTVGPDGKGGTYGSAGSVYMQLNPELITTTPDFTVDYAVRYEYFYLLDGTQYTTNKSIIYNETPVETIGFLKNMTCRSGGQFNNGEPYRVVRWYVQTPSTGWQQSGFDHQLWGDGSRSDTNIFTQTITRDESDLSGGGKEATYQIYKDANVRLTGKYSTENAKKGTIYFTGSDAKGQVFYLFRQAPVSVFSVRIYDAALTKDEIAHNRFVDLAAYCGADLTEYAKLAPSAQTIVENMLAGLLFDPDAASFEANLKTLTDILSKDLDIGNSLYVSDGLTVLLAAYNGFHSGSIGGVETPVNWFNAVESGSSATLRGKGWKAGENGGFTIVKTWEEFNQDVTFGLYLPTEKLPEGSYTVEIVANPVGITNPDGSRYIDDHSTYGQNFNNGFAIGPMRCLQFVCMRPTGKDGQLEKRWVYQKETNAWAASGYKSKWTDTSWRNLGLDQILTYSITHTLEEDSSSTYQFKQDSKLLSTIGIAANNYIPVDETDRQFQLMVGVAGTIFAARVYNRPLTNSEVMQNHMADLVYFYGLDTTFLESTLDSMDDATALYAAFADMDFSLERDVAQEYFESKTAAIWLTYNGFSIRNDMTDGVRFYFDLNQGGIDAMLTAGFALEIGTVVNIGKDALPVLDDYGYDYKVLAFDSVAGKYDGFFIDDNTYAVTLRYNNANRDTLLSEISVRGYVKLTSPDGDEMLFYADVDQNCPTDCFDAINKIVDAGYESVADDNALSDYYGERIAACYDDVYVYVDANAAAGGDGSAEAPFAGFNDGWNLAKELMLTMTKPTYLYLQTADGVYGLYGTLSLSAEEKPFKYCNFVITSENGNSILTTNIDLDSGDFVYEGDNMWTYQFEKNADGKYPEFRYLYVNDAMAHLSASSAIRARDVDTVFKTAVERTVDAIYYNATLVYNNGDMTLDYMPEAYVGREDLESEFRYYAAMYTALSDVLAIDKTLLNANYAPVQSSTNVDYVTAFNNFLQGRLAYEDLRAMGIKYGVQSPEFADFKADVEADERYRSWFTTIKTSMLDNKTYNYTFTIAQRMDPMSIGKIYLNIDMIGDLSHMVEEGKLRMDEYAITYTEELETMLAEAELASALAEYTYTVLNELYALVSGANEKYLTETLAGALAAATKAYEDATAELELLETEYDALLAAYESAELEYDAAVAALENADEGADLDALQAAVDEKKTALDDAETALLAKETAIETAVTNFELVTRKYVNLTALDTVYQEGGVEAVKVLEAETATELTAADKARASALTAYNKAQSTYNTEMAYIAELKDENLWVRHALTQYMIEMHMTAQWDYNIMHVTGIDYADTIETVYDGKDTVSVAVYLEMDEYSKFVIPDGYKSSGRFVFLKNILEYVDSENEFFYDSEIGKLYYYTEDGVEDKKFSYPTSDYMFMFYNLENVSIENLKFTGVDDNFLSENGHCGGQSAGDSRFGGFPERSAILIKGCYGMTITGCNFYDLGVEGITCRGWIEDLTIDGNTFENIGAAAIRLGGNTATWEEHVAGNLRVTVINNYCNNIATEYHQSSAVQIQSNKDCVIQNNTLRNTSYTAFSLGWRWSTVSWALGDAVNQYNMDISANYIYDFMTEMADGGAIYMLGGNADYQTAYDYFNFIHHNYIVFTNISGDGSGGMICGIYFDGSCTHWHCYSNVVVEQSYGAHVNEDEDRGQSETYINQLRKRRNGSTFIYIQHIPSQLTYHILVENNIIINVRSKDDEQALKETYKTYVVASRFIKEQGTRYVRDIDRVPSIAEDIMYAAGAFEYPGDPSMLYGNDY